MRAHWLALIPAAAALALVLGACGVATPSSGGSAGSGTPADSNAPASAGPTATANSLGSPVPSDQVVSSPAPSPYRDKVLEALLPDSYTGIVLEKISLGGGDFLAQNASSPFNIAAKSLGIKSAAISAAAAGDPTGRLDLAFGIVRFKGVNNAKLLTAFQGALQTAGDQISTVTLGGKELIKMKDSSGGLVSYGFFYAKDDMLIGETSSSEATAASAATALP